MSSDSDPGRDKVLAYIRSNPGCTYRTVYVHNHMAMTEAGRILSVLEDSGQILHRVSKGAKRYYPVEHEEDIRPSDTREEIDFENLFSSISVLRGIRTGTEADGFIDTAVAMIEARLSDAVERCPHCGSRSRLLCTNGQYRIECTCGALFAYSPGTRSASDTVRAYNRRCVP